PVDSIRSVGLVAMCVPRWRRRRRSPSDTSVKNAMPPSVNLARLLSPATLAVVGANEKLGMSNNAVLPMLEAGRTVHLVNPNRDVLYGQPAWASLSDLGQPVDAVLSLVNAERSIGVLEEAAALGCGGVVVAAAGFA